MTKTIRAMEVVGGSLVLTIGRTTYEALTSKGDLAWRANSKAGAYAAGGWDLGHSLRVGKVVVLDGLAGKCIMWCYAGKRKCERDNRTIDLCEFGHTYASLLAAWERLDIEAAASTPDAECTSKTNRI